MIYFTIYQLILFVYSVESWAEMKVLHVVKPDLDQEKERIVIDLVPETGHVENVTETGGLPNLLVTGQIEQRNPGTKNGTVIGTGRDLNEIPSVEEDLVAGRRDHQRGHAQGAGQDHWKNPQIL